MATNALCFEAAALATPVVPPVYWNNAMSSWLIATLDFLPSCCCSNS
ncbi:MAG UNVERIFIED_CONTAM: hypothetical protein LVT10_19635 [Anaerolineae bacterium]